MDYISIDSDVVNSSCRFPSRVRTDRHTEAKSKMQLIILFTLHLLIYRLQCFDAVGWAAGKAYGL